jgi:hypothetical protein
MTNRTNRFPPTASHLRAGGMVALALTVATLGFTACGVINKVKTAVHDIRGNKATIDAFNTKLQSGAATTFEATYVTTGRAPATIVYAVQPPQGVAFNLTPTGGTGDTAPVHLVANASGEYACTQQSSAAQWMCQKLGTADAKTQNEIFSLYTPAHWIGFLRDFSLAAGFVGDKVTSSTMTVNGFSLNCVDFRAAGVAGTSTICSTEQGILGYVRVASDSTSFEITNFSTSPDPSLFQLPPGATVTTSTPGAGS